MLQLAGVLRARSATCCCVCTRALRYYSSDPGPKPPTGLDNNPLKYLIARQINKDKQQEQEQNDDKQESNATHIQNNIIEPTQERTHRRTRSLVRGGTKHDSESTSTHEATEWMAQRKQKLLARLKPKGTKPKATENLNDMEANEDREAEDGDEEDSEEADEDLDETEGEQDKDEHKVQEEQKQKEPKPMKQLTLSQIRERKRELLRLKRMGEVEANDERDYDDPTHWRTLSAVAPPDDYYPNTLKARAEKISEEIRSKEAADGDMHSCAPLVFKRGMLLLQSGLHVPASADFEQNIAILDKNQCLDNKLYGQGYHFLAISLALSGRHDEAFRIASRIPQVYARVNVLAAIHMHAKRFTRAIKSLKLLGEYYNNESPNVNYNMGECYKNLGMNKDALEMFTKATAEQPTLENLVAKAQMLKVLGKIDEARAEVGAVMLSGSMPLDSIKPLLQLYSKHREAYEEAVKTLRDIKYTQISVGDFMNQIEKRFVEVADGQTYEEAVQESDKAEQNTEKRENEKNAYVSFRWAKSMLDEKQWALSLRFLDDVLSFTNAEPKLMEEANRMKTYVKQKIEMDNKALQFLDQQIAAQKPQFSEIYLERAAINFRLQQLEQGVEDIETARKFKHPTTLYLLLARILEEGGQYQMAADSLTKEGELTGKTKAAINAAVAAMYARNQEFKAVIHHYSVAIAYEPNLEYFANKAIAYAEEHNYTDAVMALTEGMGKVDAKQFPSMYMLRAKYNSKLRDFQHATSDITVAFNAMPQIKDPEWYSTRAAIHFANQNYPAAISDCDYVIANSSMWHSVRLCECYLIKTKISIETKAFDFALKFVAEAMKYNLEPFECLYLRARIYTNQGLYTKALVDLNNACNSYYYADPDQVYLALAYRGFLYHNVGKLDESKQDWDVVMEKGNYESQGMVSRWQRLVNLPTSKDVIM